MRIKNIILLLFVFSFSIVKSQNLITNPDFELYTGCPTNEAQADSAISWFDVIQNSDYYNCGLSTGLYVSNSLAYSGTGFVGFASYGDLNGSAEAIGQNLTQPLLSGHTYNISYAAKKPTSGQGVDTCGGVALYGFKYSLPPLTSLIHASQIPSAILLGIGAIVQDTAWQIFSFNFVPTDSINHILFTVEHSPSCYECIFLDSVDLHLSTTSILEYENFKDLSVYPNPSQGQFSITNSTEIDEIIIHDIFGRVILIRKLKAKTFSTRIDEAGVYLISVKIGSQTLTKRITITK
jgi:hypothetical protein